MAFKCSICLEFNSESGEKDWFVNTPGGHVFHYLCIKASIDNGHRSCPICREVLSLESLTRLYGMNPSAGPSSSIRTENRLSMPKPDYKFKLVMLGNSAVGKSCLHKIFSTGVFHCGLTPTIGCDMSLKTIEVGGKVVKLNIWDTAGQEKFRSITQNYMRNSDGIFLVYDVTQSDTFDAIPYWISFINTAAPATCVTVLVGNKIDQPEQNRIVTTEQGQSLATNLGISFFETSAKECHNVEAAFRCLVGEIIDVMNSRDFKSNNEGTRLQLATGSSSSEGQKKKEDGCFC